MSLWNVSGETFRTSGSEGDMRKVSEQDHKDRRTKAIASEKVGKGLAYQAADRTGIG